jgi:ATP-binding protein involved in chromosome partitioning
MALKVMSMGFLVDEDMAVAWRGPMLFKAMNQLFLRCGLGRAWIILLIDLPPGTGDVQLSMVQKVPVSGALTVCTPQNIALADVKKSIDMFERVNVPILRCGGKYVLSFSIPEKPEERTSSVS